MIRAVDQLHGNHLVFATYIRHAIVTRSIIWYKVIYSDQGLGQLVQGSSWTIEAPINLP